MKPLMLLFFVCSLSACSSTQQLADDLTLPELLTYQPLPAFPRQIATPQFKIDLEILVAENGSVRYVSLLTPTGEQEWDSAAIAAIKQWVYVPAYFQGKPVRLWLHQTAVIQFTTPHLLTLAEIVCPNQQEADSVYDRLKQGCKFCDAAKKYSISKSREKDGVLGEVNIHSYPDYIQRALEKLDEGSFSSPLKYGTGYIIFFKIKMPDVKASMQ